MKKIKYIVFVLLVLALFALYTYANAFHVRNVEVTLGSKSLGKDELIING